MNKFCCKCGKVEKTDEAIIDGFCISCYKDEFPLIDHFPEKQLKITACKKCGDLMYHSKWLEVHSDPKPVILEFLNGFIKKTKKVKGTETVLVGDFEEPSYDSYSKQTLTIVFEGSPNPEVPPYQQEVPLDLIVNIGVCERCAKFTRGYFESIVQVRSDKRAITEAEQLFISEMINEKKKERAGNRMAYIAKTVDQTRGGIDLYVGTEKFAKTLTSYLAENLAASIEYSTKLKSMKDGKPIYQSTHCIRVPYFEIGDVIKFQNNPYQIIGIKRGRVEILSLLNREAKTLSHKESHPDFVKVLKKMDQLHKFILMAIQPPNVSVMNSVSFETLDIDIESIVDGHKDGDEILMAEIKEGLFECQKFE